MAGQRIWRKFSFQRERQVGLSCGDSCGSISDTLRPSYNVIMDADCAGCRSFGAYVQLPCGGTCPQPLWRGRSSWDIDITRTNSIKCTCATWDEKHDIRIAKFSHPGLQNLSKNQGSYRIQCFHFIFNAARQFFVEPTTACDNMTLVPQCAYWLSTNW